MVDMNIGLIDVDGHNWPNLALMKLSAHHKKQGDHVEWWNGLKRYDVVYKSKVFDDTYSNDIEYHINADNVVKGGTGYDLENKLPDEIEHIYPDYKLYEITNTAYGYLTRGCPRNCPFCIVSQKEGISNIQVAELSEFWNGQKNIKLLDPNLLASDFHEQILRQLIAKDVYVDFTQGLDARLITNDNAKLLSQIKIKEIHFAWDNIADQREVLSGLTTYKLHARVKPHGQYGTVYILCNFNTTIEEDLYRIRTISEMEYDPFVMIYNKPSAPPIMRYLQRWCNNKIIFRSQPDFGQYNPTVG